MLLSYRRKNAFQVAALLVGGTFLAFIIANIVARSISKHSTALVGAKAGVVDSAAGAVQELSKLHLQEFYRVQLENGRQTWEVRAKDAKFFSQDNVTYVTDAEVRIHRGKNSNVVIRSRAARLFMEGDNLKRADLEGDVVVVFDESLTVKTQVASYNAAQRVVTAPGPVDIQTQGFETSAVGMEAHVDDQSVKLLSKVVTRIDREARVPNVR